MKEIYKLYLPFSSESFEVSSEWLMIKFIDKDIQKEFKKNKEYTLKSQVRKESLQLLLNYLKDGQCKPKINNYNRSDLYLLCTEFNIWDKIFSTKSYSNNVNILKENSNLSIQEIVAKDLDQYLLECSDDLFQIPIQSLIAIFNHPERNLTRHNFCYSLILKNYEKYNDKNIFILLQYLDGSKLDKSNLDDSIANANIRYNYKPSFDHENIIKINDKFDQFKKEQQRVNVMEKQIFNSQRKLIDQLKRENENLKKNKEKKRKLYKSIILKLRNEFEKKLKSQKEEFENKIKQLENQLDNARRKLIKSDTNTCINLLEGIEFNFKHLEYVWRFKITYPKFYLDDPYHIKVGIFILIDTDLKDDSVDLRFNFYDHHDSIESFQLNLSSLNYNEKDNEILFDFEYNYEWKICDQQIYIDGFRIKKAEDGIYYCYFNSKVNDEEDPFYEFMIDFQNKVLDISPPTKNSCIDQYENTNNFCFFFYEKNDFVWTITNSTPKSFYFFSSSSCKAIFPSIFRSIIFECEYKYKLVSGISIYGQDNSYYDKPLEDLEEELETIRKFNNNSEDNSIDYINDINENANIITGICCSNGSCYSNKNLNIMTTGIYYTDQMNISTIDKSKLICNGNQYINDLTGSENIDIIMGNKATLHIQVCSIGIDHFTYFTNSILYIKKYRDGNIDELKRILNNALTIYNNSGCSLNYDKTAFIFRLSGFVVNKNKSKLKQIKYNSENIVSLKFRKKNNQ